MSSASDRQAVWQAFLQRWPLESLKALTLEEYSQSDEDICFAGWVKRRAHGLGWKPSPGAGMDQIGICAFSVKDRDAQIATYSRRAASRVDESRGYCWRASFGESADQAFETVKKRVIDIVNAATQGQVHILNSPLLHDAYEWKIFFLYQNPESPVLLPVPRLNDVLYWYRVRYKRSLRDWGGTDSERAVLANNELIAERHGRPLFDYVDELVAMSERDYYGESLDDEVRDQSNDRGARVAVMNEPLNQILYGPPGTGKTYATIERALRILDPALLATLKTESNPDQCRAAMKARFDVLKAAGRVRFVTFHQSFSYEDFVEGIRAQSGPEGLRYSVEPGVFKQLCQDVADMPDVDKVIQQFLDDAVDRPQTLTTPKGKTFTVTYQEGNETVACLPASSTTNKALPANIDAVKQVLRGQPPQKIYCESYVLGIANHLKPKLPANGATAQVRQPHVLIIDEINRGNVSRIFGELITLIEPSKRAGQAEALSTTLPYSRELFTVPDNVYLIGTMNTADRSLASLDVALRRRFVFEELPPEPALLNGVKVAGRLPVDALLSVMNQRIEALLDRDHLIGHASFMPLVAEPTLPKLAEVFRRQVLPLLQEYFFEDWQRIQWVLNDHRKPKALQFVRQSPVKVADLFGANVQVSARPLWEINEAAFDNIEAYVGVISSPSSSAEEASAQAEDAQ